MSTAASQYLTNELYEPEEQRVSGPIRAVNIGKWTNDSDIQHENNAKKRTETRAEEQLRTTRLLRDVIEE